MKINSIKFSDYFELVRPTYIYLQITPHKSIRNYNSSNIAKAIAHTYRAINRRIYKAQKKLFFETTFKISYMLDITENDTKFYFIIPKCFSNIIIEKCKEIWSKATLEIVEPPTPMGENAEVSSLTYKREDALSLAVDKKSNEPLNSILSVMDIMREEDRIRIIYNFMPSSQFGWLDRYNNTMEKIKEHRSIDKKQLNFEYVTRATVLGIFRTFGTFVEVINDFLGGSSKTENKTLYKSILGILEQQNKLSPSTNKKKEATVLNTQIAVISESKDSTRRANNTMSICQAYRTLDEDNELISKPVKKKFNVEDYDLKIDINTFSTDEISNFLQIPARSLLLLHKIKHINVEENNIPAELRQGIKRLGVAKFKGATIPAYLDNEYNNANLPLVLIGSQGGGKTTYIGNYSKDCINAKEGVIVLDFIKNCSLSETIKKYVPKNKLIELDLAKKEDRQGLGYNEIKITEDMDIDTKLKLASLQAQQVMSFIDSISLGDTLSSRMRRFLNASARVVFVQGANSIRNVIECLEDYRKRETFINNLSLELKERLGDNINALRELDEWSKGSKKEGIEPQITGSNTSKIEGILDRIGLLKEDYNLEFMYNKNINHNIDFVKAMEQGKVILIKMKEGDFPTKMQKNILVTYFITKVWLASQLRGMVEEKPLRTNLIIDEVFQSPTSLELLKYILPQSRKFACKTILSTQYINQLESIFNTLEASGSSFMLLKGSTENDFNHFKSKLDNFEYEDLKDMEKFSSMNLIYSSEGYSSFITKLPLPS